jgi:hypothetical protein
MTGISALSELIAGKKVRRRIWPKDYFVKVVKGYTKEIRANDFNQYEDGPVEASEFLYNDWDVVTDAREISNDGR